ncbi:hypothetical protein PR048_016986 [Dryococelus australis]|uniref:Uncharacterized protein n=1 Tax=Dryococelus australis TaxID=614101 RepID=A0ABQ9H891_9NEOP|nr:hypothetical protein PR048_016986 [Dryococelus australis]
MREGRAVGATSLSSSWSSEPSRGGGWGMNSPKKSARCSPVDRCVFRLLRRSMEVGVENEVTVTTTCVYLHNFFRKRAISRHLYSPQGTFETDIQDGSIIPGTWHNVIQGDSVLKPMKNIPHRNPQEAKAIRDEFIGYFMSDEGRVPWQDRHA